MTHSFIITTEEREKVTKLIEAASTFHEMSWKIEDYSLVTTDDETLAAILDQVITNKVEAIVSVPKKSEKKTATRPMNTEQLPTKKRGKGQRSCYRCHKVFENEGNGKLCPECRAGKETAPKQKSDPKDAYTPWKIVRTGEHLTASEISEALRGKTLEIGSGWD